MNSEEIAFLGWSDGNVLVGHGPFTRHASPPSDGAAFYKNDFGLSQTEPWLVPASWELVSPEKAAEVFADPLISVDWDPLDAAPFASVFQEITSSIRRGTFEKTVPVVVEHGKLSEGQINTLLHHALSCDSPLVSYGFRDDSSGFAGMSPEHLLKLEGSKLRTMALAGTARAEECEVLAVDEKEIREHEFVAQALVSQLGNLGKLVRGERGIMKLGPIVHFHTPIEVDLDVMEPINSLITRLHPTPALGPLPRTSETMTRLIEWRNELGAPAEFGAPFGAIVDGVFRAIVAIRGVWWNDDEIILPAGCGVIEPSRLVNEWRELRLKREAVKSRFGI